MTDDAPRAERTPSLSALVWILPVVICVNAGVQRILAETQDLNPWKGGGFGMFAEPPPYRVLALRPWIVRADGKRELYFTPIPTDLARRGRELGVHPTRGRIVAFARDLLTRDWVIVPVPGRTDGATYPVLATHPDAGSGRPIQLGGILIEMNEYEYDPETRALVIDSLVREEVGR